MAVFRGKDTKGSFYQWGKDAPGKKKWTKYYYTPNDKKSRMAAKHKATKQGLAAYGH